ncbi:MAG: hypothetical protein ACRDZ7_00455 [Acidimicrobiia bacterium]
MPTLEDTIDFPVTTLNDLLDADARVGVAAGADEEKYRKWAFVSTGAAGILAVILLVVLVTGTGGGGGGEGERTADAPAGTRTVAFTVSGELTSEIKPGAIASVLSDGIVIASGGTVRKITEKGEGYLATKTVEIAVQPEEADAIAAAKASRSKLTVEGGKLEKPTPTTAAPAAETPAPTEPAPVPVEPAPAPSG